MIEPTDVGPTGKTLEGASFEACNAARASGTLQQALIDGKLPVRHEPTVERELLILALLTTHGWSRLEGVSMRCATKVVLSPKVAYDGTIHAVFNKTGRFLALEVGRESPFVVQTTLGDPSDVVEAFNAMFNAWADSIGATFEAPAGADDASAQREVPVVARYVDMDRKWYLCHAASYQNAFRKEVNGFGTRGEAVRFAEQAGCAIEYHECDQLHAIHVDRKLPEVEANLVKHGRG
ncbi:hypothetical protein P3T23_009364 [Paraburkholderia sp. GAS448]|uniref:hypothetical protein n=1 Tax=Paraburkholderia sp. GAS448 TaxID=3035136 RepID=UPI003D25EF57